jgi:hypothetical protein
MIGIILLPSAPPDSPCVITSVHELPSRPQASNYVSQCRPVGLSKLLIGNGKKLAETCD